MARLLLNSRFGKRIDRWAPVRHARWLIEAGLAGAFWLVARLLPPDTASAMGGRLLGWLGPRLGKSEKLRRNLSIAFPGVDREEIETLVQGIWTNTGSVFAEYPHLGKISSKPGPDQRVDVVARTDLSPYVNSERAGIFVTMHLASWEVAAAVASVIDLPLSVIYAPLQNPYIDRMMYRMRSQMGARLIDRNGSAKELMRELHRGRSLGLIVDHRDDDGVPIPFFGHDKLTSLVPARLALKHGVDLLPARIERLDGARFRATIYKPLRPAPDATTDRDRAFDLMRQVNAHFESWIRERPQHWHCTKRAWAKDLTLPDSQPPGAKAATRVEASL